MPKLTPRTVLAARLGVGAIALLAPGAAARVFGIDPVRYDAFVARLFGSREVALDVALLAADGAQVRQAALIGAAVDGVDVVSAAVEVRRGNLSTYGAIVGGGGAALFAALGLLAARESALADHV